MVATVRDDTSGDARSKRIKFMEEVVKRAAKREHVRPTPTTPAPTFQRVSTVSLAQEAENNTMDRAIFEANVRGDFTSLVELVQNGASANYQRAEADGSTGLIAAVRWGNLSVSHFMLKHGANVSTKDFYNKSALMHAGEIHDAVLREQMFDLLGQFYLSDYGGEELQDEDEEDEVEEMRRMFDFQSVSQDQRINSSLHDTDDEDEESATEREFRCFLGDDEEEEDEEEEEYGHKNYYFDDDDEDDDEKEEDEY